MPGSEAELRELDELRHKLNEYEAALRSAAPRLAAFKRLEQLARTQGTSPEAIASQAAVEVMKREKDALVTLLAGLANERDQLKGEVAMLLINKTEASKAVAGLQLERDDLNIEVAEIVDQLSKIRGDAVRLMSERSELTVEVSALREEVRALHDTFQQIERARTEQDALIDSHDRLDSHDRRGDDAADATVGVIDSEVRPVETSAAPVEPFESVSSTIEDTGIVDEFDGGLEVDARAEALAAELEENKAAKMRRESLVPRRTNATTIETDDETEELESQRFDAFFHAEIDHDKSRDWILG